MKVVAVIGQKGGTGKMRISPKAITRFTASRSPVSVITIGAKRRSGLEWSFFDFLWVPPGRAL